jgi:tRNA modification GTPase
MSADTIYAVSSAPGKAGVAVVRVSGATALTSCKKIADIKDGPAPRHAYFCGLFDPRSNDLIDRALVLYFKAPASFTGEEVVEYHLHGSPAVCDALLSALSSCEGHRQAEPGEFTRRAFENGKLDLTEAEAVADLINAETEAQRLQALSQMGGALSRLYEGWRERLIRAMAYIEAVIDFPDEDIPDSAVQKVVPDIERLIAEIENHLNDDRRGERLRSGIHVAILGAPNAGKSSLLNLLSQREVAIVSPMAGTTRDVIEVALDLGGYPVVLADTAGLREGLEDDAAHGSIEKEGIRRALEKAKDADLRVLVFDATQKPDAQTLSLIDEKTIAVLNKMDDLGFTATGFSSVSDYVPVSAKTGENLDVLLKRMTEKIAALYSVPRETPSLTRARHRAALEESVRCLRESLKAPLPELMAEDIRIAARALGRITGRVDVEDLLDVIFRDFCIGK